ncbi:hypothetical protein WJX75_003640 [Coccomyxa subellipsoidea]|uniref:Uncharacterized protein n=1 Tax=Coccomyxa subellipsoidea TaxID=248742 RepID=A0ABR2YMJ9_9CHLO
MIPPCQRTFMFWQKDITHAEREAIAKSEGGIVTYKAQLSVGLHILVMMGTFFAAGYMGVSYLSKDPMHHVVGGLVGLIFAMLMETLLLIIRTTVPPTLPVEEALRNKQRPQGVAAAEQHARPEDKKEQ